jgi:hypothetical protein
MGRPEEVAALVLEGRAPAQIAAELGISYSTTLDYLERAVAKGILRRSDVIFTLPAASRSSPATREDRELLDRFGSVAHALGDLYEILRGLETSLHSRVREALESSYGTGENGWWVQGVPASVRKKCQSRREDDPSRLDPYCYTDLLDLHDVFESEWRVLQRQAGQLASDKRALLAKLRELNRIRNMVMHPVRGMTPTEDDFVFVRSLQISLAHEAPAL